MNYYTIYQVHKKGLLKNTAGKPYKHMSSVANVLKNHDHTRAETPHGMAKLYHESVIKAINEKHRKLGGR